jgi:hypothetical protein
VQAAPVTATSSILITVLQFSETPVKACPQFDPFVLTWINAGRVARREKLASHKCLFGY